MQQKRKRVDITENSGSEESFDGDDEHTKRSAKYFPFLLLAFRIRSNFLNESITKCCLSFCRSVAINQSSSSEFVSSKGNKKEKPKKALRDLKNSKNDEEVIESIDPAIPYEVCFTARSKLLLLLVISFFMAFKTLF